MLNTRGQAMYPHRRIPYVIFFFSIILFSCGDGDSKTPGTIDNIAPVANAGVDQTVEPAQVVILDAIASSDTDGTIATYSWIETTRTGVTLDDPSSNSPTFEAPSLSETANLQFQVTVTDDDGATSTDDVNITVNPAVGNTVSVARMETSLFLNQLYFEYANRIGEKVWVLGFFGNSQFNKDGMGYLVDNTLHLQVDEVMPHHSFARLNGTLPPDNWQGNLILAYGEINDYATVSGTTIDNPIPLLTVEKYELVNTFIQQNTWNNTLLPPDLAPDNIHPVARQVILTLPQVLSEINLKPKQSMQKNPGTQAQDCDRTVIISGGVNENSNYGRYKDNVVAKYNKMKEFGFTDDQIEIFYNDGGNIDVNGSNIVDEKSDKEKIKAHLEALASSMPASCTLTVFVTDHGTGYNPAKGYRGARPALSGDEASNGALYDENTFIFDARAKTYQISNSFVLDGKQWYFLKEETGEVKLYLRVGDAWEFKGSNANGDNIISETELGGFDLNDDGDTTDADFGYSVEFLESQLSVRRYKSNQWDTDGNGIKDIQLRHDGSRFVVERLENGEWQEMGRDTNGDFFIDIIDGGVDWNLDGDKADQIGFHEGINMWGSEVLWDDEFAESLSPLAEGGKHIMVEMVSCYSGGFLPNIGNLVENIYAGSSEETPHKNRKNGEGNYFAADEMAFLDNLAGIDTDSWNTAASAATLVDDELATSQGATPNVHVHNQTQRYSTESLFEQTTTTDKYRIELDLPDELIGQIYDYEFIFGLQKPRWSSVEFPSGLPTNQTSEDIPGGIKVVSTSPIVEGEILTIKANGMSLSSSDQIRIEFTDINHNRLGYTMANFGDVAEPSVSHQIDDPLEDTYVCNTEELVNDPAVDIVGVNVSRTGNITKIEVALAEPPIGSFEDYSFAVLFQSTGCNALIEMHAGHQQQGLLNSSGFVIPDTEGAANIESNAVTFVCPEGIDLEGTEIYIDTFHTELEGGNTTCDTANLGGAWAF